MKVLIISPCILPLPAVQGGAVETLIHNLLLQNENHANFEFEVVGIYHPVAFQESKKFQKTKFIFLKESPFLIKFDILLAKIIKKILQSIDEVSVQDYFWKFQILGKILHILIHNNYDRVVIENAYYLLSLFELPFIRAKYSNKYIFHIHNTIKKPKYRSAMKSCGKILLVSEYLRKSLIQNYGEDVNHLAIVLYNGIKFSKFDKYLPISEKEILRSKLGMMPDDHIVIFAGRLTEQKGILELLEAVNNIKVKKLCLLIVGSCYFGSKLTTEFELRLFDLAKQMEDRVHFTGFVPNNDIWRYFQIADVAVVPSIREEAAGLAVIEALASGLPVITTNVGGIPEYTYKELCILINSDNSIVDNIRQSILDVVENLDEWKKNKDCAKQFVLTRFSDEAFYNNFVEILQNVKMS